MKALPKGIRKHGSSYYVWTRVQGRYVRRSCGADLRTAVAVLNELKKRASMAKASEEWIGLEELSPKRKQRVSFAEAAESYLNERRNLKQNTLRCYREILKNHLLPEFGQTTLENISEERIARFQAGLASKLSARRVNNIINLLRYILKVCTRRKILQENPSVAVDRLKEPPADIDPFSEEELEAVLANLRPHWRPFFICQAWTGARPNELMALRWTDVDFRTKEIKISKGRVRGKEGLPKTNSSCRAIPMFSIVEGVLVELKQRKIQHVVDHVFLTQRGQPINKHVDREWRLACKRAGIRHRPSYQLRHTFASVCLSKGIEPGWIAKVLGHSTIETTFRHYARFVQTTAKANENRVEEIIRARHEFMYGSAIAWTSPAQPTPSS